MVLSKDGSTVWYVQNLRTTYLAPPTVPFRRTVLQFNLWSVQYQRTVPVPLQKRRTAPYFLAKIEAYHTVLTYRTILPSLLLTTRNFNWLWNHLPINQRSQFKHSTSASAVFCFCIQKAGAMCEKSGIFNSNHVPNVPYPYHYKKGVPYQRTVPVPSQKKRTLPAYRISSQKLRRTVPYCHPWC